MVLKVLNENSATDWLPLKYLSPSSSAFPDRQRRKHLKRKIKQRKSHPAVQGVYQHCIFSIFYCGQTIYIVVKHCKPILRILQKTLCSCCGRQNFVSSPCRGSDIEKCWMCLICIQGPRWSHGSSFLIGRAAIHIWPGVWTSPLLICSLKMFYTVPSSAGASEIIRTSAH